MNFTTSYAKYILSRRATKRVVIFILVTFIYNFFAFPVHAAEPLVYSQAADISIIKKPSSETKRFERLVSAPKENDTRPELVKSFKLITPPSPAKPIMKGKNPVFTDASHSFKIAGTKLTAEQLKSARLVVMTAYNSEVGQTDGDPCTTADGFNVCKHGKEDVVAANFLPFGTRVMVPELFGDRVFVVHDRTARKFGMRMDFWFKSRNAAMQFGKRQAHVIVLD